jgi:hypothetical protein
LLKYGTGNERNSLRVAGQNRMLRENRDLTILGRQRDGDGQNKLLQINGSKDSLSYNINRVNLVQF